MLDGMAAELQSLRTISYGTPIANVPALREEQGISEATMQWAVDETLKRRLHSSLL